MNLRLVVNQFALLALGLAALLAGLAAWAGVEWAIGDANEAAATKALAVSAAAIAAAASAAYRLTRRERAGQVGRREALLLVAVSWLGGAAVAAAPFLLWARLAPDAAGHPFANPVNAYFEAMSGLTTTGATILPDIDLAPRSILLWRAMTHWLGGLGIVVLFVAVLPSLGAGGKRLFKVEAPGPRAEGVHPHVRETARTLWKIYLGLTLAEVLALRLAGVGWYKAVNHTFATLATGGFSTFDSSIAGFDSLAVEIIIIAFMLLAGVNFGLYFQLLKGRPRALLKDTELRVYLAMLLVGTVLIGMSILGGTLRTTGGEAIDDAGLGHSVRYAAFQAVAIQTTTGFATADFNGWPFLGKAVLLAMMFIGGSAGSTAGGLKVVRVWILFKVLYAELEKAFRPAVVRSMRIGRMTVDSELRLATVSYVMAFFLVIAAGAVALMLIETASGHAVSVTTAATATIASVFNIGPGLHRVGPTGNYAFFTDAGKLILALLMAVGRLELFAIAVLFTPRFWRRT